MLSGTKNPVKARAGAIGARKRWGPLRVVRLDTLPAAERRIILSLVEGAKRAARSAEPPGSGAQ